MWVHIKTSLRNPVNYYEDLKNIFYYSSLGSSLETTASINTERSSSPASSAYHDERPYFNITILYNEAKRSSTSKIRLGT